MENNTFVVEQANLKRDASVITDFQLKLAFESEDLKLNSKTVEVGVEHVFKNPHVGTYYVALKNEKVVASLLTLKEWSDWRARNVLWIHSVYVDSEFRRTGIFKSMYQHLQEIVDGSDELAGLRLYVDKSNQVAIDTYHFLEMNKEHYHLFEWLK
ncbi:MAG: GNAT family N-acetyltransferase [Bacteriovoracaceae bacterium]|jgi:ribosomal protein S18 acetylase RimI-like enzyme|nr:GNAT family N-acetyltransferase [Bacteriovoracaceae bacterium]